MDIDNSIESPFSIKISFDKYLRQYEDLARSENNHVATNAKRVLDIAQKYPILREGFSNTTYLYRYNKEIEGILQDAFSPVLTNNEIKTASVPFHNFIFNSSERFKKILNIAGEDFELEIKNMPTDQIYIVACTIILNYCYGYSLNFKRPFFYEIPDENGIMRYYKILYNADFTEVVPTKNAPKITEEDYEQLLDNFDNIELWKEKFPPNSYDFKGFVISNIFDVTDDQSISNIKSSLIGNDKRKDENFMTGFYEIFRSLFGLKNIEVGFSIYDAEDNTLEPVYGVSMKSFLVNNQDKLLCTEALCSWSYNKLVKENNYFSISDVDKLYDEQSNAMPQIKTLYDQGYKSAIFAPIANEDGLMGVLEIVSKEAKLLNSINANKLVDIMPYIVAAVEQSVIEEENLIEAVIQKECTSIHPSVHWKFVQEAKNYIKKEYVTGRTPVFKRISFDDVYPLFGQIDIKGSSTARNEATQKDLSLQLSYVKNILDRTIEENDLPIYEQIRFQVSKYIDDLEHNFKVDSEHDISVFLKGEVKTVLELIAKTQKDIEGEISEYFNRLDKDLQVVYFYRKHYDDTVKQINTNMSSLLDKKQIEAQKMYPHFFERFKTDGVEHNMYIGESITKQKSFSLIYLYNLRLWQLQVMCEMENAYYLNQHQYPIALDVASMILAFNQPLSIRFRMDEKQFDVDGTYNARYEVVKKRVDKALIKGTSERITQKGKIAIVYSQKEDQEEYTRYVKFLQSKKMLDNNIEYLELEDLQGVTGLKAIRVGILYKKKKDDKKFYNYEDLMQTIKA